LCFVAQPENLLLDASGRLKISDFGLSCLPEQRGRSMDSLQTTCGTPNYVAPEVLRGQGYDGRSADVWSCGCILYVLCSGHMPFDEPQLAALFVAITQARYRMPAHFSAPLQDLIRRILNPDPKQRATVEEIQRHEWFTPGYVPAEPLPDASDAADGQGASDDEFIEVNVVRTSDGGGLDQPGAARPPAMTAFDLIGSASGLDLSAMFQRGAGVVSKQPTRFPSAAPAADIVAALQKGATSLGLTLPHGVSRNFKVRMEGTSRRGPLVVVAQVFEMCPGFHMVEVRKVRGDLLEFQDLFTKLEHACASVALQPHQPQAVPVGEGPARGSQSSLSASI
jgi:serine/threonine protein kinase